MNAHADDAGREQPAHLRTGADGEEIACEFLQKLEYLIIAVNVRIPPHDEIDIVAYDPVDRVMVFAEVKTRSRVSADFRPELDITPAKRRRMTRAARGWVDRNAWPGGYRLDVIAVAGGKVRGHYREVETSD